ncbi:MAG: hypothetical protein LBR44_12230 [Clostridiales Family XIII bacterium]|nr:hypothetical protein [Clostridiales Family XIII bacterium]
MKRIAGRWAELEGQRLLAERDALNRDGVRLLLPRADAQVQQLLRRPKPNRAQRRRRMWTAIAACLAVYLILPHALLAARDAGGASAPQDAASTSSAAAEPIPIPFHVPEHYAVLSASMDNGVGVYYIAHEDGDDVVVTVAPEEEGAAAPGEVMPDEVEIDGETVAAAVTPDYKMLSFEKGGDVYTLSCREDMGTLAALYRELRNEK